MTCIVGLLVKDRETGRNRAYIGGDRRQTRGTQIVTDRAPKIWPISPNILIGAAGVSSAIDRVRYNFAWPEPASEEETSLDYLKRVALDLHNFRRELDIPMEEWADFLLVTPDHLFIIAYDSSVIDVTGSYTAIGSGLPFALGALTVLEDSGKLQEEPRACVEAAIRAAIVHDASVGPPIDIMSVGYDSPA